MLERRRRGSSGFFGASSIERFATEVGIETGAPIRRSRCRASRPQHRPAHLRPSPALEADGDVLYRERSQRHHEPTLANGSLHRIRFVLVNAAVAAAALWLSGVTPAHMQSPSGAKAGATARPRRQRRLPTPARSRPAAALRILFLGHDRPHHPSGTLLPLLAAPLARRGIQITHVYTPEEALDPAMLKHYDALMIYANHEDHHARAGTGARRLRRRRQRPHRHPLRVGHVHRSAALHPDRRRRIRAPRHG